MVCFGTQVGFAGEAGIFFSGFAVSFAPLSASLQGVSPIHWAKRPFDAAGFYLALPRQMATEGGFDPA
ncbi:MAG: hypothetical protein RIG62_20265 [Cyclobacteriaceae bacterium]